MGKIPRRNSRSFQTRSQAMGRLFGLLIAIATLPGCNGGGTGSGSNPPPPPTIDVSITPPTASVLLGKTVQLTATVTGTSNRAVAWSVNGASGGSSTLGSISSTGLYTAPADLPSPANVKITATSAANPANQGNSQITVTSDIVVGVSPGTASEELGAQQNFAATLASAGQPDASIRWSASGGACPNACGSVSASGTYTAPQILPSPASVVLTAQSAADPSKRATVNLTITSRFLLQLTAPGTVTTSATAVIAATLTPVAGSNPSTIINWSLGGTGCCGTACGTLSSVTTQNTGVSSSTGADTETANYTAPGSPPTPNTVTITATPLADPTKRAQATILVQPGVGISLTPITATLTVNHRVTLSVQVNGASNSIVNWSVGGVAGGNASLGQICAVDSNSCRTVTSSSATQVDYVAPASLPFPNPVTVRATSAADGTKSATAQITVINHDVVSVLPGSVTLAPGAVQVFFASVLGTTNQSVVWQLQGTGCSTDSACGTIAADGTYTAPGTSPTPNTLHL